MGVALPVKRIVKEALFAIKKGHGFAGNLANIY
jgi:hypothetical protein